MSQHNQSLLNIQGLDSVKDKKIGIVSTEWNDNIVAAQVLGAESIAGQIGLDITHHIKVPGCVEIPFAIQRLMNKRNDGTLQIDAIIAFGAVVRGDTPHFDYVCNMVSDGINHINLHSSIPIIFGVLTVNNMDQAWERLGGIHGHKGEEAMITAAKMIMVNSEIG